MPSCCDTALPLTALPRDGESGLGAGMVDTIVPIGVVTLIALGSPFVPHSILYPGGKNVLKP